MGYYIFSQGIDTNRIQSVFGCKDQRVWLSIKESDTFENYKDFLPEGLHTTPEMALEQIINGHPFDAKSNFAYGYAVICICKALGEDLPCPQEIKLGYETDFINKFLAESFEIRDFEIENFLFADNSNPFSIPPIEDWPLIGLVNNADLKKIKEDLKNITITDEEIEALEDSENEEDEEKGFAYEHIKGLLENIDFCVSNNLDLISFCH